MSASFYHPFYLILITILTFAVMKDYVRWKYINYANHYYSKNNHAIFLAIFLIFFIGLRPVDEKYFVDMYMYDHSYYTMYFGERFWFNWDTENYLFDNFIAWMGSMKIEVEYFFLIMALIYFGCMLWACWKLFPKDSLLTFLMYLGAFSTFSFGTNGIKAGVAASLFLIALAYYKDNKIVAVLFLWLSLGFHHSMLAPVVAFVIAHFYKNPKAYLSAWFMCLLLAAVHVTFFMNLFSGFTDDHGASYLEEETEDVIRNVSGFRPDFILYSAVPIIVGYLLISTKQITNKTYHFLWSVYTLTNCVFLLCTYGSFINRIAYLSWLMLPFVLLYPFTNIRWSNRQNQYLKYVVFGHLGFTLFMFFIYGNLR
ncbi:MAG: EpsG family protein [Prevotella sp.]|nr:EpsG family protein [Prevotella sp.]